MNRKVRNRRVYAIARNLGKACRWLPGEKGHSSRRMLRLASMIEWADANGFPIAEQAAISGADLRRRLQAMGEFDVSAFDEELGP